MRPGTEAPRGRAGRLRWSAALALASSLAAGGAALELASRLSLPPLEYVTGFPFDAQLGYRARPGGAIPDADERGSFLLSRNAAGFRGPPPDPAPPEVRTLVFLGDEELVGHHVRDPDLLPARVARALDAPSSRTRAVSLACEGYSVEQSRRVLKRFAPVLASDDVVLVLSPSRAARRSASPSRGLRRGPAERFSADPGRGPAHVLRARSRLFQALEHRWLRLDRRGGAKGPRSTPPVDPNALERDLRALEDCVRELGAALWVVLAPRPSAVQVGAAFEGRDSAGRVEGADERAVLGLLERLGIPAVSLSGVFRAETAARRRSLFSYEGTWNARGHAVAANAVTAFLNGVPLSETAVAPDPGAPLPLAEWTWNVPGGVDLTSEPHPELLGPGWLGWRGPDAAEKAGWKMGSEATLMVPGTSGGLVLVGWVPASAGDAVRLTVGPRDAQLGAGRPFTLRVPLPAVGGALRRVRLAVDPPPDRRGTGRRRVAIVLRALAYE